LVGWAALSLALVGGIISAQAADTVRLGKSVTTTFGFMPAHVGVESGIFAKHGLDVQITAFEGEGRMQQGFAAGAVDIGLGGGPSFGFVAKGIPATIVGALADAPLNLGMSVAENSDIHKPEDLKGKKIGVATTASLTYWLAHELSRRLGWGLDGIKTVALGGTQAGYISALKTGSIDGFILSTVVGYRLEREHAARVLLSFGDFVKDYHTHVILASNEMVKNRPDVLRRFLAAWIETIEYVRTHKAEFVTIARKVSGYPEDLQAQEYDSSLPMLSRDLRFNQAALETIARSLVETEILPQKPDMSKLYTEAFLPGGAK
jgi:ABC-type nitrate/sulfonate/bicarbonate transport system substrate-binding protein